MAKKRNSQIRFLNSYIPKSVVLVIGIILVLITGIFVAQESIEQSQETRKEAAVADGKVTVQFNPANGQTVTVGQAVEATLSINTQGEHTDGVQLVFDVITNSIDTLELIPLAEDDLRYILQEVDTVDHGFKVNFAAIPPSPTEFFSTNTYTPFLKIRFTPVRAGEIAFNFDPERSGSPLHRVTPTTDELRILPRVTYVAQTATTPPASPAATPPASPGTGGSGSPTTQRDDFYFSNESRYLDFTFYEENTNTLVQPQSLVPGRRYTVRHQAKIMNALDGSSTDASAVEVKVRAGNSGTQQQSVAYRELRAQRSAILNFSFSFVATESNVFSVTIDPNNTIAETSESNNSWTKTYTVSAPARGGITVVSCNQICTSNNDCAVNHRCYDDGSVKRCRLATNVTSTSCTAAPAAGPQRSCNQSCSTSSDCVSGLSCWNGSCRNPVNVSSTSCAAPTSSQQAAVVNGCNERCASNNECDVNLRCYQGYCRLATNPSSLSCSTQASGQASTPYTPPKGGTDTTTASPSPSPVASASPRPTVSPSATQSATATQSGTTASASPSSSTSPEDDADAAQSDTTDEASSTVLGDILGRISELLATLNTRLLGMIVAGIAGVIALIIIVRMLLGLGRRPRARTMSTPSSDTPPSKPVVPPAPKNPSPVPQNRSLPPVPPAQPYPTSTESKQPQTPDDLTPPPSTLIATKTDAKETISGRTAPSQHKLFSADSPDTTTPKSAQNKPRMVDRLEKKGVSTPLDSSQSNPKTGAWPSDKPVE